MTQGPNQTMPIWFGPLLLLLGGICIGFAPIGLRLGLDDLGPQAIAFWRYVFATPMLFALILVTKRALPGKPNIFILIGGVFFALDIAFWHWSLTFTTVANSTFLVSLGNLCVGLTAWIFLRERPGAIWALAVFLAVTGAAALSLGGVENTGSNAPQLAQGPFPMFGEAMALVAAVLVSGYIVASKLARRSISGMDAIFWLTLVELGTAAVMVVVFGEAFWPSSIEGFMIPLFLAIVVQVGGQGLIITGLGHTSAAVAGILIVVQPVVAAIISWNLFGETLVALQLAGCGLILGGILLAQFGNQRQPPTKVQHEPAN